MTPAVFLLVLLAAFLHASWNALVKVGSDGLVRLALVNLTSGLLALSCLPLVAIPAPQSWPFLLGSVLVHQVYYLFLVLAYRAGDLSVVYPVARGVAPALVAVGGALFAAEHLSGAGLLAVALICLAILSNAFLGAARANRHALVLALATGCSIAAYSVLDGLGGRRAGDVFGYIAWLFVIDSFPIVLYALHRRRAALRQATIEHWRAGLGGGCLAFCAYGVVIWAMTQAPMTFVSALRETSVVMAALIGTRLMAEGRAVPRVAAALLVTAGVALLHLSG